MLKKFWKKLPIGIRNEVHRLSHRLNSSRRLLWLIQKRHSRTVRKIAKNPVGVYLRIGESRPFSGWLSTNFQVLARNFLDATRPFGKNFCRVIYADNVIEHLSYVDGQRLIANSFAALRPEGVLRITTPDLGEIVKRYLLQNESDLESLSRDMSMHSIRVFAFPDFLRVTFASFGHHKGYIYDFETLSEELQRAGFIEIRKYQPGFSETKFLCNLESRIGESDMWSQMSVEAKKPRN